MTSKHYKYYCTCRQLDKQGKAKEYSDHTQMRPTEVDDEEVCINCGFYAMQAKGTPKHMGNVNTTHLHRRRAKSVDAPNKGEGITYSRRYDPSYMEEYKVLL